MMRLLTLPSSRVLTMRAIFEIEPSGKSSSASSSATETANWRPRSRSISIAASSGLSATEE